MDNYITKEYLTEHIKTCWINGRPKHAPELHEVLSWIDEVPSEDVQPVVHGEWRDTGSGQECSVCDEIQYGYDSGRYYCANCGAKMDKRGGADNEND